MKLSYWTARNRVMKSMMNQPVLGATIQQIARDTGISRSSVRDILDDLHSEGVAYVHRGYWKI